MNMIATVATKEKAWQLADKLFPTDYSRNEPDSLRAGYPIFNTTSTDSKYKGFHISDLNAALELNMGAETIRINISEYETKPALEKADKTVDREAEIKDNFDKLLQYVSDKRKSAELHEDRNTTITVTDRLVAGTGRRNRMKHIRRNGTTSSFRCTH